MKLKELMEKITPGPYDIYKAGGCQAVVSNEAGKDVAVAYRGEEDAAYLAHCANHLPKVLEALKSLVSQEDWQGEHVDPASPVGKAFATIAAAEEVDGI